MPSGTTAVLAGAKTLEDIAAFLDLSDSFLRFTLYGRKDRYSYRKFRIPKKRGGFREISAPPESLRIMQRKLASALLALHPPKPSSHGFLKNRSIVSNAQTHEGQRVLVNIDLKDFFPTIHLGRIVKALQHPPYSLGEGAAVVVAQVCCDDSGALPQGAPSSPIVSNIICRGLDDSLQALAKVHGCRYTRYADDITISTSRPSLPPEIVTIDPFTGQAEIGKQIERAINSQGFQVNPDKFRLASIDQRQEVTGLTTNEHANVARRFIREMDSLIHCWRTHGLLAATDCFVRHHGIRNSSGMEPSRLLSKFLQGKLSYLKMVKGLNDPICRRIGWELYDLAPVDFPKPIDLKDLPAGHLRGYRGRFRGWQRVTAQYLNSIKFVQILKDGLVFSNATAFVIDSDTLVTAGHVVSAGTIRIGYDESGLIPSEVSVVDEPGCLDLAMLIFDGDPFQADATFHFQYRLPEIGEEVAALGFPRIPNRDTTAVMHTGTIEALPTGYKSHRFLQTSFQSGGGLSGGPLVDKRGLVLGLMIENVFMDGGSDGSGKRAAPPRPYGQAIPFEYVARKRRAKGVTDTNDV